MKIYLTALAILASLGVSLQHMSIVRHSLRIVNGTTAEDGEFPYLVELRESDGFFDCGGGILGPEWILTAGHCVNDKSIVSIVYGTIKLYETGDGNPNTSIKVKNWFQHPNYSVDDDGLPIYDVGILQLEEPIPLGEKAQPLKLVEAGQEDPFHVQGVLAGWGDNDSYGHVPTYLQKIYLQFLTDQECVDKINGVSGKDSFKPIHHLCSSDYFNGASHGDSGSPFVINGTTFGLVSWSYHPADIFPAVHSRLSNPEYRNWIKNVTNI